MSASVIRRPLLDLQVCVPDSWTDEQVLAFAEVQSPSGTDGGWKIRRAGDELLRGDPERAACASKPGHVHIVLETLRAETDALKRRAGWQPGGAP